MMMMVVVVFFFEQNNFMVGLSAVMLAVFYRTLRNKHDLP